MFSVLVRIELDRHEARLPDTTHLATEERHIGACHLHCASLCICAAVLSARCSLLDCINREIWRWRTTSVEMSVEYNWRSHSPWRLRMKYLT